MKSKKEIKAKIKQLQEWKRSYAPLARGESRKLYLNYMDIQINVLKFAIGFKYKEYNYCTGCLVFYPGSECPNCGCVAPNRAELASEKALVK